MAAFDIFNDHRYPTLPADAKGGLRGGDEVEPGSWIANVTIPISEDEEEDTVLDRIAPKVDDGEDRALIPTLPGESQLLSPLMLWWRCCSPYRSSLATTRVRGIQRWRWKVRSRRYRSRQYSRRPSSDYRRWSMRPSSFTPTTPSGRCSGQPSLTDL